MTAEIPNEMYENKIDEMVRDFEMRLSQQGLTLDLYLSYTGMAKDAFRKTFEENAQKQVKLRLALEKIAELENIEVSDADAEEEIKKIADQYRITVEQVKQIISVESVREDLKVQKASDIVKESAKIA